MPFVPPILYGVRVAAIIQHCVPEYKSKASSLLFISAHIREGYVHHCQWTVPSLINTGAKSGGFFGINFALHLWQGCPAPPQWQEFLALIIPPHGLFVWHSQTQPHPAQFVQSSLSVISDNFTIKNLLHKLVVPLLHILLL